MNAIEKMNVMASWSLDDYDAAGAHINEHFVSQEVLKEKIQAMLSCSEENSAKENSYSIFFNKKDAEELIHEALQNQIMQMRIRKWVRDYKNQTRIIVGYPADKVIGCVYDVDGKNVIYSECTFICLVFLKTRENEDFKLYTAYPTKEKEFKIL